jgi:hypothetical protein
MVKVRDEGHIQNKAIYVVLGVNLEGQKRVQVHDRIQLFPRPVLPELHFLDHRIGHVGDQGRRDLNPVHLLQVASIRREVVLLRSYW